MVGAWGVASALVGDACVLKREILKVGLSPFIEQMDGSSSLGKNLMVLALSGAL